MDDRILELASRSIDEDLDPDEVAELERAIAADPALASQLDSLRRMRGAVARLAHRMDPPDDLDEVLQPLRRGVPPRAHRGRPLIRWLAAAAAAVIGVTLAWEVARQSPGPGHLPLERRQDVPAEDREIFQLRPLPTSSVSPEEEAIGAADRLLTTPLPSPKLDEPAPLEIVGPLRSPPSGTLGDQMPDPYKLRSSTTASLAVRLPERQMSARIELAETLPAGAYSLRITVAGGRIVAVDSRRQRRSTSEDLAAALTGIELAGLADSDYAAELVVEVDVPR
jgi:hypothetical protein